MPLAGEMKLGDGEGGDGTGAEVALRLLPLLEMKAHQSSK